MREGELSAPASTTLSDGSSLESLIDCERRSVSMRVLTDPEIFQLELERIFARTWVAVAHESEIPNAGDYVTRYIGEDPVIVTRNRAGEIHILLNVCTHRGMQVCRAEMGRATTFRCPYHGWVFDQSGALKGTPVEKEMYGGKLDKSRLGLREARVETAAGMVFGTWDSETPPLDEYLGEYRWYLDAIFNRSDGGLVVAGPPQRWRVHANWKLAAEQFAGDGYHALTLHRSMQELGLFGGTTPEESRALMYGTNVTANGHGLRCLDTDMLWREFKERAAVDGSQVETAELTSREKLGLVPPPGMTPELATQVERHLSPGQMQLLADAPPTVGSVFPNLAYLNLAMPAANRQIGAAITWRVWVPRGPAEMEIFSWALVERDASDKVRALTRQTTVQTFSSSGIFEQDDAEGWSSIQKNLSGVMARRQSLNYQAVTGEKRPAGWQGGGLVQHDVTRDDNQWSFWLRWYDLMMGKSC